MYHIKDDQRAKRSAETIYTTLATFMREKPFDAIRVSDIVAHWVKTGKRQTSDQLADTLQTLLNNMISINQLL